MKYKRTATIIGIISAIVLVIMGAKYIVNHLFDSISIYIGNND